ncbi:MAG: DUF58 domain-containing protein [Spirochaetota bacterium]
MSINRPRRDIANVIARCILPLVMTHSEILKNIRRIEITTSRIVNEYFSGQYHSAFKGRGMEFDEVRQYIPGDDVRDMDWNVTARYAVPHVKRFREERELTVMLLVDVSPSTVFGSTNKLTSHLAAEVGAVLAFSAMKNNDKVGLALFSDEVEEYLPPKKGRNHVLAILRTAVYHTPRGRGTDLAKALSYISRIQKKRAVIFLLSDFHAPLPEREIDMTNRTHDLVAVRLSDPRECSLPAVGILECADAETGKIARIDTFDRRARERYERACTERSEARTLFFRRHAVDTVTLSTGTDYAPLLARFFRRRGSLHR